MTKGERVEAGDERVHVLETTTGESPSPILTQKESEPRSRAILLELVPVAVLLISALVFHRGPALQRGGWGWR